MMTDTALKTWIDRDGQLLRLRLARPKANIIDAEMIAALQASLADHADNSGIKAVLLDHEGPHFSFGASVEEHLPGSCDEMLKGLHALIKQMIAYPVPVLVSVKGQCLGGGLEVACGGQFIFISEDAVLGQPEMKLAVFAPAASCLLPERVGQAKAEDMLWSGRNVKADEAVSIGLAQDMSEDPEAAALAYFEKRLAPMSASSLRLAVKAARMDLVERLNVKLDRVEALYLQDLMNTSDAVEGLNAFIEKRSPKWENK